MKGDTEKETSVHLKEDGEIIITETETTTWEAAIDELENAVWLRETPAGLIASALHGGRAKGFHIAISDISTANIRTALEKARSDEEAA